jgi:hypothetical protein
VNGKTRRAGRRANVLLTRIHAFCEHFTVPWATFDDAERAARVGIAALSHTERDLYRGLINRWVQAWNAWARLTGDPRRFVSLDARRPLPPLPRTVRCVLPLPSGGPITGCDKNGLPVKDGKPRPSALGEVEIVLSNGSRRIGLYDTEVFCQPPPQSFGPPPDFRRTPGGYCY